MIYTDTDKEQIYDEQIFPLMDKIIKICEANNIPLVASFNYAPGQLCTTSITPDGCDGALVAARRALVQLHSHLSMLTMRDGDGKIISMTAIAS